MVKCSNCGVDVPDDSEICPNCGNSLVKNKQNNEQKTEDIKDDVLKCENCGSELSENTLFCSVCGTKVNIVKKQITKACPNCGVPVEEDTTFCPECGANIFTGEKSNLELNSANKSFSDKIDLNTIIKPTVVALVASIILSLIGLLIGLSWLSFVIAIILSVGFFAAAIDNEANAIIFGLIVGLILGFLENPLVESMYGALVAGFYEGFLGSHLIILVIVGVVVAYISNIYLKESILNITKNFRGML
jgi:uncharacterized membrane protein YvbJ